MKRNLIALATASLVTSMNTRAESPGALTPELLEDLRDGYEMDAGDRARHNAVTSVQLARGKDNNNFHEIIERPKSLMDKNDHKIKKQENDNLQEIFYKGSSKKGTY